MRLPSLALLSLALASCTLPGCGNCGESGSACCPPTSAGYSGAGVPQPVHALDSLNALKAEFNAHADRPRILLLVSPACSECIYGAEVVRTSIMDAFAASGVYALVVWEPMIDGDSLDAARQSSAIFAETPSAQYYDEERLSGWAYEKEHFAKKWDDVEAALPADHWLRSMVDEKPVAAPEWDVYMLFKPGVKWETQTPKPDAFIRHMGRNEAGLSNFWRDRFNTPPITADLHAAMAQMGKEMIGQMQAVTIEFLGSPDCPNTPMLRDHLRAALSSLSAELTFIDVDQSALPAEDVRRGWPAPTILVNGLDLFGMPTPTTAAPGCRIYAEGVPTTDELTRRLKPVFSK